MAQGLFVFKHLSRQLNPQTDHSEEASSAVRQKNRIWVPDVRGNLIPVGNDRASLRTKRQTRG